ncbi:MAG: hypothetical protein DRN08_04360 [Thermoplasmata archaeon]|nr:MAG: hypothetical protein DRN05_06245 [Thermoplasmata archaeon]RLF34631.1 MAG: hypothetical protein DRN08_04360 [Thermoplasmata archaeon]
MKLTIVYDNEIYKREMDLRSDWGFSCLINTEDETILFDTGGDGNVLLNNMRVLDVNPKDISKIVISHEHYDHNGGLKMLSLFVGDADLFRLDNTSPSENLHLFSISSPYKIADGIFTTGRLRGTIDEQSLILKGEKGIYVLVGCSHPGVVQILNAARKYGNCCRIDRWFS